MRCPTKHGTFQCDRDAGHVDERGLPTECETTEKSPRAVVAIDFDAQRELLRAASRIEVLRKALEEIRTTPCEASGAASCLCCMFDRMIAANALKVLE